MEDSYLSLERYPSVDVGCQKKWLYVPNESPPLPSYSPYRLHPDTLESWSETPTLEDMWYVPNLVAVIQDLKGRDLMRTRVIRTLLGRQVLPLKMRNHP
jgi:hypothetical protein